MLHSVPVEPGSKDSAATIDRAGERPVGARIIDSCPGAPVVDETMLQATVKRVSKYPHNYTSVVRIPREGVRSPPHRIIERAVRTAPADEPVKHWNPQTGEGWQDIRKAFCRARKKAGLDGLWFHDLRQSFVTRARKLGVPESVVMRMSGHCNPRRVEREPELSTGTTSCPKTISATQSAASRAKIPKKRKAPRANCPRRFCLLVAGARNLNF